MNKKIEEEWRSLDHDKLIKYMRYDYKSSALYKCGKNINQLTTREKFQLIAKVFENFYKSGYSKYNHLFSELYINTFKNEIDEIGIKKVNRFLSRYIIV